MSFLPGNPLSADDKGLNSIEEYEIVLNNYLEIEKDIGSFDFLTVKQVVIYDCKGNITRQIDIKEDIEVTTPAILKPMICNSEFLTKIDGVYYYMCNKM
jgi:hypothetical protein